MIGTVRDDVEGKADIVEEVVRIVGVDEVPAAPFPRGDSTMVEIVQDRLALDDATRARYAHDGRPRAVRFLVQILVGGNS